MESESDDSSRVRRSVRKRGAPEKLQFSKSYGHQRKSSVPVRQPKKDCVEKDASEAITSQRPSSVQESSERDNPTLSEEVVADNSQNETDDAFNVQLRKDFMKEYDLINKKYEERVATDGYDFFKLEPIPSLPQLPMRRLRPQKAMKEDKDIAKFYDRKKHLTNIVVTRFEEFPDFPTMTSWFHTNVNVVGKEDRFLNGFPYFGDKEEDAIEYDNLAALFPDGILGALDNYGYVNDWILLHLCDGIMKRNKWTDAKKIEYIMVLIKEFFPNLGALSDIISSYKYSLHRFNHESAPPLNNIYDREGKISKYLPPETIQHSLAKLICKRCFTVGCIFHPPDITANDSHLERIDNDRIPDIIESCGPNCYKNYATSSNGEINDCNSLSSDDNEELSNAEKQKIWTAEEKSWIDMLKVSKIDNTCRISQFLNNLDSTKTCKQVFDYINEKEPLAPIIFDLNRIEGNDRKLLIANKSRLDAFRRNNRGGINYDVPFRTCKHFGECTIANGCSCKENDIVCTKFCACPTNCKSRFPGCFCAPGKCNTHTCTCFYANWECDPDLCRNCNCDADGDLKREELCNNINIQRGYQRKLYLAHSDIEGAGSGCFAEEDIPKGEFIGEYCGEIISQNEGDRRGIICDAVKRSYLFNLNSQQVLDAGPWGNILRFVNHSSFPNCHTKVIIVAGEHKIAFFACKNIQANEELFFNYQYNADKKEEYKFTERKRNRRK